MIIFYIYKRNIKFLLITIINNNNKLIFINLFHIKLIKLNNVVNNKDIYISSDKYYNIKL